MMFCLPQNLRSRISSNFSPRENVIEENVTPEIDVAPKKLFFKGPSIKQESSIPSTIIYYISKNPSNPKTFLKLMQSCKYFFEQNKIIPAFYKNGCIHQFHHGPFFCLNDKCDFACYHKKTCCVEIDIKNIPYNMLWLTPVIRPKFYRCEFYKLALYGCSIKYAEFKSLILTVKEIYLAEIKMKYEDGNIVMLENILEAIPNIEDFYYAFNKTDFSEFSDSTIKNISKLKNFEKIKSFNLNTIHKIENMDDLFNLITVGFF